MKFSFKTVTLPLIALAITACGGASDNPASKEAALETAAAKHGVDLDATVRADGTTEKLAIKQGIGTVGQNLDLPADFPEDVYVSARWNVIAKSPVPPSGGYSLQSLSSEDIEDIASDIRSRMTAQGWTEIDAPEQSGPLTRVGFEKGSRIASFNIIPNGETNAIQLVTMMKP